MATWWSFEIKSQNAGRTRGLCAVRFAQHILRLLYPWCTWSVSVYFMCFCPHSVSYVRLHSWCRLSYHLWEPKGCWLIFFRTIPFLLSMNFMSLRYPYYQEVATLKNHKSLLIHCHCSLSFSLLLFCFLSIFFVLYSLWSLLFLFNISLSLSLSSVSLSFSLSLSLSLFSLSLFLIFFFITSSLHCLPISPPLNMWATRKYIFTSLFF